MLIIAFIVMSICAIVQSYNLRVLKKKYGRDGEAMKVYKAAYKAWVLRSNKKEHDLDAWRKAFPHYEVRDGKAVPRVIVTKLDRNKPITTQVEDAKARFLKHCGL